MAVNANIHIDAMQRSDWLAVRAIYGEGLATGLAAFIKNPPKWPAWDAGHLPVARHVARRGDTVVGWGALSPVADT